MRRFLRPMVFALVILLAGSGGASAQTLHAIIVVDMSPAAGWGKFAPNLMLDSTMMVATLLSNVPEAQLNFRSVSIEEDQESDPENLTRLLAEVNPAPTDTVLFYYSGHGAADDQGHYLALAQGKLYRQELRHLLENKGARLTVLITDCCNSRSDGRAMFAPAPQIDEPKRITPAFQALLFEPRGIVDINGCSPGESAFFTPNIGRPGGALPGSLFTKALTDFLREHRKQRPSWDQLVRDVSFQVHVSFRDSYPQGAQVAKGAVRQKDQTVHAVAYPEMPGDKGPRTGLLVRDYEGRGALIIGVDADSPASQVFDVRAKRYASLGQNQVIIEANGAPVTSMAELVEICRKSPQILRLKVLRGSEGAREYLMRLRY